MSRISDDLQNKNSTVKNLELVDYLISIQLNKIERYNNISKKIIDDKTENAMSNMVELLKLRQKIRK